MKLYSNTLLTWPSALHLSTMSRIHQGKWFDYHIYKITCVKPLIINSYSSITKLRDNHTYYCYYKYNRAELLERPNTSYITRVIFDMGGFYDKYDNKYTMFDAYNVPRIRLPNSIQGGDIIVIHDSPHSPENMPIQLA